MQIDFNKLKLNNLKLLVLNKLHRISLISRLLYFYHDIIYIYIYIDLSVIINSVLTLIGKACFIKHFLDLINLYDNRWRNNVF